jgi:dienelactone hydrolase
MTMTTMIKMKETTTQFLVAVVVVAFSMMVFVSANKSDSYEILQTRFGMENTSRNGVEIVRARYGRGRDRTDALVACPVVARSDDEGGAESSDDVVVVPAMVYAPGFGASCTTGGQNYLDHFPKLAASHGFVFVCPEEPITSNVPGVVNDEGAANLIKAARALIRHQPCEKFGARVAKSEIAVVGYSMGGGSAIRAASEEEEAPQRARRGGFFFRREEEEEEDASKKKYLFSALVALAPFNGFVNVKDVEIPSLLIVGASDVVTRPSEVELVYDERIASKQKALIILRDKSHEHAVTSSAGVAIGFLKRVFRGERTTTTTTGRDEDKEEQEVDKLAMAAMESILNRKSKEKESEEDPSVEIQRVRARGF